MHGNIPSCEDSGSLCGAEFVSVPKLRKIDASHRPLASGSPAYSPAFGGREGIFTRRQGADRSCGQAVRIRVISACFPSGDRPCDRLARRLRIVGNNKEPPGPYDVAKPEAIQRVWNGEHHIFEGVADLSARQLPLIPLVLNRNVMDARIAIPLRQHLLVREQHC